ncbi:gephyrin-like molybdotransferase Glp [Macrococcoides caseolyticum]|uniref:molybdopterin molybdotransferase MoeA n=1 Tax=Macrococcoides caseolyticum TaxID=69966 RepID=UPI001F386E54|nr:gephyrin-like molybdotransferase Glp [Macrococcus caseolyticus]MCE4956487.1 molybdopterin molybdotransferase MoeA [Macrococcus caseolyticus]
MLEKRTPIPVREAIEKCIAHAQQKEIIKVNYLESLNYVLAEDIIATYDIPMFNKSPYDGFAIRSEASMGASGDNRKAFTVIDHIGAGTVSDKELQDNEAVRIMTGAEIPAGADAVVMLEQTVATEDGFTLRKQFVSGENISFKGEECRQGDVIIQRGTKINAGVIAVLATFSYAEVKVYAKPTVAIIATGSELIDIDAELTPGKIRNSNGPMIMGLCKAFAIEVDDYDVKADDYDTLYAAVKDAYDTHDIVITTGGVSVGDFDYMPQVYQDLEADVLFNKIAMRPGSVTTVAVKDNKFLFGLSGNPSACYTGFELYTRPVIRHMMGEQAVYPTFVKAKLSEDFTKANPFTRFIRADLDFATMTVKPSGFNKSNAVIAIATSNSMIVLPGGTRGFVAGDTVDVLINRLSTSVGVPW